MLACSPTVTKTAEDTQPVQDTFESMICFRNDGRLDARRADGLYCALSVVTYRTAQEIIFVLPSTWSPSTRVGRVFSARGQPIPMYEALQIRLLATDMSI
jgi:hypothetical protein